MPENPTVTIFKEMNQQRGKEGMTSEVARHKLIPDKTALRKHLIEVGRRIQIDAENGFVHDPRYCKGIKITAEIIPLDSVTTIKYEIEEYADPRVTGREELSDA